MMRAAASTPRPLPRQREHAESRNAQSQLRAVPSHSANSNGLAPAQAIQTMDVEPLARPDKGSGPAPAKAIQKDERESNPRLANLARIDALRVEIRLLVESISLGADVELLDLMRDEVGSYSRHKAAQDARTWAGAAGIQLETGLMMLDRAMRPTSI